MVNTEIIIIFMLFFIVVVWALWLTIIIIKNHKETKQFESKLYSGHIYWRKQMEAKFNKSVLGQDFHEKTEELIKKKK
jgi:predicted Holliday junction resolvase-like endonuclease